MKLVQLAKKVNVACTPLYKMLLRIELIEFDEINDLENSKEIMFLNLDAEISDFVLKLRERIYSEVFNNKEMIFASTIVRQFKFNIENLIGQIQIKVEERSYRSRQSEDLHPTKYIVLKAIPPIWCMSDIYLKTLVKELPIKECLNNYGLRYGFDESDYEVFKKNEEKIKLDYSGEIDSFLRANYDKGTHLDELINPLIENEVSKRIVNFNS